MNLPIEDYLVMLLGAMFFGVIFFILLDFLLGSLFPITKSKLIKVDPPVQPAPPPLYTHKITTRTIKPNYRFRNGVITARKKKKKITKKSSRKAGRK